MSTLTRARDRLATVGGAVLGATFRAAGTLRPTAKPLHPRGRLHAAVLRRHGLQPPVGVAFLDEPGTDDVLVRLSRATGLPAWLPDIHGVALRVPVGGPGGGHADLLLASTGWGRLSRYLLTAGWSAASRPLTSLLPYDTPSGAVLLGGAFDGDRVLQLACAVGSGEFRVFGEVVLGEERGDPVEAFDPVLHQVPGLSVPGWVRRLREPAYAGARASRHDDAGPAAEPRR